MRRLFIAGLAGAALAALATTLLVAQQIGPNLSGNECWNAGQGPGGPSVGFVCLNASSSRTAATILTAVSGSFTVGTASGNFTVATGSSGTNTALGGGVIIAAQPSAGTWTLPPNPMSDGAIVKFCNGTNAAFATNVVTVAANTNQTLVPTGAAITLTTLAANTCVGYGFSLANTSWYKVQ
jgi:hypothetical protein